MRNGSAMEDPAMAGDESQTQMPLGFGTFDAGGGAVDESVYAAPRRKSVGGLLLLLCVLAIGGGTLWVMRMSGGGEATDPLASDVEAKINQALMRLARPAAGAAGADGQADTARANIKLEDPQQIIAMFADDPIQNQVTLEEVKKNPFELNLETSSDAKQPGAAKATPVVDTAAIVRAKQLRDELGKLTLKSVLRSSGASLAMISGKVVREGDTIGSFTITSITPTSVQLTAEGNTYMLKMQMPEAGGN